MLRREVTFVSHFQPIRTLHSPSEVVHKGVLHRAYPFFRLHTITIYWNSEFWFVHKMRDLHDPAKVFLIQKLLSSLSRRKSCDVRLPIPKPILHDLIDSLQHTNSSAAQYILFSAMFLTAFYGFFWIGELAAKSVCSTVVQYENLRLLTSAGKFHSAKMTIRNFKHNTTNRPFDIVITGDDCSPCCPVASDCSSIAKFAGISQVRSFVNRTIAPFQLPNLILSSGAV